MIRTRFGQPVAKKVTVADCMKQITGFENWKQGQGDAANASASATMSIESPLIYPTLYALTRIARRMEFISHREASGYLSQRYVLHSIGEKSETIQCYDDLRKGTVTFEVGGSGSAFRQDMIDLQIAMKCSFDLARKEPHVFGSVGMSKALTNMVENTAYWTERSNKPQHSGLAFR